MKLEDMKKEFDSLDHADYGNYDADNWARKYGENLLAVAKAAKNHLNNCVSAISPL